MKTITAPKTDLTGLRQGKITILRWSGRRDVTGSPIWAIQCDCGTVWERTWRSSLTSCGCGNAGRFQGEDLTNQRFGKVTVTGDTGRRTGKGYIIWAAQCDCGNTFERASYSFTRGTCTMCQTCHRAQLDTGKAWHTRRNNEIKGYGKHHRVNRIASRYAASAQQRGLLFMLTKDEIHALSCQPCHYCGTEAEDSPSIHSRYNGIDRIDSHQGYTLDNCVPCCTICNRAKSDMSDTDFMAWIKQLCAHQSRYRHL